jgi:hypothetical protein
MSAGDPLPGAPLTDALTILSTTSFAAMAERERIDVRISGEQATGLQQLADLLGAQYAHLSFFGKKYIENRLLQTLDKIRQLRHHISTDAGISEIEVRRPIFIVTPARSGSTFLQRLLAADRRARWARPWEASYAPPTHMPACGDPGYFTSDPRITTLQSDMRNLNRFYPQLYGLHETGVNLAEECFGLLEPSFRSPSFVLICASPEYLDWLDGLSREQWRDAYDIYHLYLRFLHWCYPGSHWVLKSPVHEWNYDILKDLFPDACFVFIHRDAEERALSFTRFLYANLDILFRDLSRKHVEHLAERFMAIAKRRSLAARERIGEQRIVDIEIEQLKRRPMDCVEMIYDKAGLELTPEVNQSMCQWISHAREARQNRQ